jgi:hypothetical protein
MLRTCLQSHHTVNVYVTGRVASFTVAFGSRFATMARAMHRSTNDKD